MKKLPEVEGTFPIFANHLQPNVCTLLNRHLITTEQNARSCFRLDQALCAYASPRQRRIAAETCAYF